MKDTSWEKEYVLGSYQKDLILPNLLRLLDISSRGGSASGGKRGQVILDLASGPGFFANEFNKKGAKVVGVEISKDLVKLAKNNYPEVDFKVGSAENLSFLSDSNFDAVVIVLAIQNMEKIQDVFKECHRVLKLNGKLFIVMNHPAFRVLKNSSWGWDDKNKVQYRRVDEYLSESKDKIQMHPSAGSGQAPGEYTISFHRPLQYYFKAFDKAGFAVSRLEEWNSNKKSEAGPRAAAENKARKEIPLFLFLEAIKKMN